jgi:preprotein translocase subunit SecG
MENVILIVHLLLALALIGIVLMQRSEGGGLGIGGGGGGLSGRAAANPLARITWGLAIAFICTSLTLTILAAQNAGGLSVVDRLTGGTTVPAEEDAGDDAGLGALLPPPTQETEDSLPLVPRGN